ncbi:PqiC family protein [Haliea atlantica]
MTRIRAIRWPLALALFAGLLGLGGCGSSPSHNYYLLHASAPPSGATDSQLPVGIGPVSVPEYLNRSALVYSGEGNRLHVARLERWGEPLQDGIPRVLGLNLAAALGTQDLRPHPWLRSQEPAVAVQLWILELDVRDGTAVLTAEWRLHRPREDRELARRISRLSQPLPGWRWEAGAAAAAYSSLLQSLTEEIASAIRRAETEPG